MELILRIRQVGEESPRYLVDEDHNHLRRRQLGEIKLQLRRRKIPARTRRRFECSFSINAKAFKANIAFFLPSNLFKESSVGLELK